MGFLRKRWLVATLILLACFLLSNCVYEYREVRSEGERGRIAGQLDVMSKELAIPKILAAGWPLKFFVRMEYDSLPTLNSFSSKNLAINVCIWLTLIGALVVNEFRVSVRQAKESKKRQWTISDLLLATFAVAAAFTYLRQIQSYTLAETALAKEIGLHGGSTVRSVQLPTPLTWVVPSDGLERIERITEVSLNSPNSALLEKVVALPYLSRLFLGGGEYDLKLLSKLKSKVLLRALRVSGRQLDAETISTIGSLKGLQSLNLMRTNITTKALESFHNLSHLQALNLIHTDVVLSEIGNPEISKSIRVLELPHPVKGNDDKLKLTNWPQLRRLQCDEKDELLNTEPVSIELSDHPNLLEVAIDSLQVFDLMLERLPELKAIIPLASQWSDRVAASSTETPENRIRRLKIVGAPKLEKLSAVLKVLTDLQGFDAPNCTLSLTNFAPANSVAWLSPIAGNQPSLQKSKNLHSILSTLASAAGPKELEILDEDLSGVDLSALVKNGEIQRLDLSGSNVSPSQIAQLKGMPKLENLTFTNVQLSEGALPWLVSNLPKLKRLSVDPLAIRRLKLEDAAILERLFPDATPPVLLIDSLRIVRAPLLGESLDLPRELTYLHVESAPSLTGLSTRATWPKSAIFKGVRDLEYFVGGGPELKDDVADEVLKCPGLQKLTFAYSGVSPEVVARIGELKKLRYLALSGSQVNDENMRQLAGLGSLTTLLLDETTITDKSIDSLLELKDVERLSICNTAISENGLARLAGLPRLKKLHCGGRGFSEAQAIAVSSIGTLELLDLSHTLLSAKAIASFSNINSLKHLILRYSQVDGGALIRLAKSGSEASFDLTYAEVDPSTLSSLDRAGKVISPYETEPDNTSKLIMNYMFSRNAMVTGAGPVPPSIEKGEIEPRCFAPATKLLGVGTIEQ